MILPTISLLGVHLKKIKTESQRDIYTLMSIAASFTIVKLWKQPKCPSMEEWIKKLWHIYNIYTQWGIAAAAKPLQSCLTLCNPIDGSPLGSPDSGILQARTLERVAFSFSSA